MEITDLKNYGKSWIDALNSLPGEVDRAVRRKSTGIFFRRLGWLNWIPFGISFMKEKKRMSRVDLTAVREKGLSDEGFIKSQIEFAAVFSALSMRMGREKALRTLNEAVEETVCDIFLAAFPAAEDFQKIDDPWSGYKKFLIATMEADREAGCHIAEIVEDTDDAIEMHIRYCAWFEIAKAMGMKDACLANCYGDDVYFPRYSEPNGIKYKRTKTIAGGDPYCDFRFERKGPL